MINRISLNGCRYVVSEWQIDLAVYCAEHKINPKWIRFKNGKFYLRLWGSYKNKGGK